MKYFKKVEGQLTYLSPVNPDDFEIYTKWINNFNTSIYLRNATSTFSLIKEKEILEKMAKEDGHFAIVKQENDELIGNCGFFKINHIHNTAELWVFVGEIENRGKGYGAEALQLLLTYGFKVLNLNNIMLGVYAFNENAIRSYEKIGFREFGKRTQAYLIDGKYHDEIYMEILAKDFEGLKIFDF